MALFVHLSPEKYVRRIRRAGIRAESGYGVRTGVYCMPMLPSYVIAHQWVRELRRGGQRLFVAVDFRIPDDEVVLVGHFAKHGAEATAAAASALIAEADDPRGYEIFVPRAIPAAAIHRVRHVRQVSGWRYAPDQHGRPPCACPVCLPVGAFKAADIRARFGDPPAPTKPALLQQLRDAADDSDVMSALWGLGARSRGDAADLAYLVDHPNAEVREVLAEALRKFRGRDARELLARLALDPHPDVRAAALG
ncbi:HEAT repeat domain-containing protein [Nocardia sp. XZ_19_385]|uniref:HEAT repeat domain-containing protein n=1 Tax=Nocardia sp. XZ_19_385 TaxID=2769488 RepID=UPI00188F9E93|nr:HEAT repeat domain-containing protein [Nocardia sp. XZ_19_385]